MGRGPPEEMKKFLAIKCLAHLASHLVYNWDKIKPPAKLGEKNPVVERGMAKVLCLACYGKKDQDFKFCKFCATEAGEGCPDSLGARVLGTTGIIDTYVEAVRGIHSFKRTNKHRVMGTAPVGFSI